MSRRYKIWKLEEKGSAQWSLCPQPKPSLKAYKRYKRQLQREKKRRWKFLNSRSWLVQRIRLYEGKGDMVMVKFTQENLKELKRRKG